MAVAEAGSDMRCITFRLPIELRSAGAELVGRHKTSMLHDLEAGRVMETDALLGSVLDLARLTETAVPTIEAVHAPTKLLGKPLEWDNQAGGAPAAAGR